MRVENKEKEEKRPSGSRLREAQKGEEAAHTEGGAGESKRKGGGGGGGGRIRRIYT